MRHGFDLRLSVVWPRRWVWRLPLIRTLPLRTRRVLPGVVSYRTVPGRRLLVAWGGGMLALTVRTRNRGEELGL